MNYNTTKSLLLTLVLHLTLSCAPTTRIQATTVENYTEMGLALATIPLDVAGHHYATTKKMKRAATFYILRDIVSILNKAVYFHNYTNLADKKTTLLSKRDGIANGAFLIHDLIKLYQDIHLFRGPKKPKPTFFEEEVETIETPAETESHEVSGAAYAWRVATLPVLKGLTAFAIAFAQDQSRAYACPEDRYSAAAVHSLTRLLDEYTELKSDSLQKKKLLTLILVNAAWLAFELKSYLSKNVGECALCTHGKYLIKLECNHMFCGGCLSERVISAQQDRNITNTRCPYDGCGQHLTRNDVRTIVNNERIVRDFENFVRSIHYYENENLVRDCDICMNEVMLNDTVLGCRHASCRSCLRDDILVATRNNEVAQLRCRHEGCDHAITAGEASVITGRNPEVAEAFRIANQYIRHCPTQGCNATFYNERGVAQDHVCGQCNQHYCSRCTINHPNITCAEAEVRENNNFLGQNTQPCPECRSPIERNGGCNQMTCLRNRGGCGTQFCYVCGERWINRTHPNHFGCPNAHHFQNNRNNRF